MTVARSTPARDNGLPTFVEPSEYRQYLLSDKGSIRAALQALKSHHSLITVFFDEGQSLLLTTLLEVREEHLVLDYGADEETNRKALAANKHYCVTQCEGVRVQFLLGAFSLIDYGQGFAFLAEFPRELLRLQRREYYRLATPIAPPVRCLLPLSRNDGSLFHYEARVHDISIGGVCIEAPPGGLLFDVGMTIPNCRLDLPEVGRLETTLTVCNLREIETRLGRQRRAGCAFNGLARADEARIQRYILTIERARRAQGARHV